MTEKPKMQFLTIQLSVEMHNRVKSMCKEMKISMKEFCISAFEIELKRMDRYKGLRGSENILHTETKCEPVTITLIKDLEKS